MLVGGLIFGALIASIAWVIALAPKHWEDHHEKLRLTEQLRIRTEERDHYKHMTKPTQWGTVDQREAGIKPKPSACERGIHQMDPVTQRCQHCDKDLQLKVEFKFDDIRESP